MKVKENPNGEGYYLDVTEEEHEKLKPFLNRYGFLDKFPQIEYPDGYPRDVSVFDWMFPEKILVISKEQTSQDKHSSRKGST